LWEERGKRACSTTGLQGGLWLDARWRRERPRLRRWDEERRQRAREDGLSARTAWFDTGFDTGIGMTAPDDESFHIVERSAAEVAS